MSFVFDPMRGTQEAAYLLKLSPDKKMRYLKLIKLLYIADRESLMENGFPISGDAFFALEHGPILSKITDYVRGEDNPEVWAAHIRRVDHDVELIKDPGVDMLSRYDTAKLQELYNRYHAYDEWRLRDLTHSFPEYQKHRPRLFKKANPIPLDDVVEAIGRKTDLEEILQNREEDRYFASLLQ